MKHLEKYFWSVATILLVMYIVHLKSKVPPDNQVLEQIIAQDSIKMADLQESVSNLLSQVEAREKQLDSLKNTHTTNFNDYRNETVRVRNLPMPDRIKRVESELLAPDTIRWR